MNAVADRVVTAPAPSRTVPASRTSVGAGAMVVSVALLYLVGFNQVSAVHNAAHDTRHTAGFPCH